MIAYIAFDILFFLVLFIRFYTLYYGFTGIGNTFLEFIVYCFLKLLINLIYLFLEVVANLLFFFWSFSLFKVGISFRLRSVNINTMIIYCFI